MKLNKNNLLLLLALSVSQLHPNSLHTGFKATKEDSLSNFADICYHPFSNKLDIKVKNKHCTLYLLNKNGLVVHTKIKTFSRKILSQTNIILTYQSFEHSYENFGKIIESLGKMNAQEIADYLHTLASFNRHSYLNHGHTYYNVFENRYHKKNDNIIIAVIKINP